MKKEERGRQGIFWRIAGAAAVGYQLWSGPGAGCGQQAKRGKYFLHDYIFLIYLLTQ